MLRQTDPNDDFTQFYREHVDVLLAFCHRRVGDAEMAADLTAEVFAAALVDRAGYVAQRGTPRQWLLGIAAHKAVDAVRRGRVERRAQRLLQMREITWSEDDLDHVLQISAGGVGELMDGLPVEQREAVTARVIDERDYEEIAGAAGVSEQVARKRVSRGLALMRRRWTRERTP